MVEIINFEAYQRQKEASSFISTIDQLYENAGQNTVDFQQLALTDPQQAVLRFAEFVESARNSAGPGTKVYEAFTGGANHDWTGPLIDIVGDIYPDLDRKTKEQALRQIFSFLDNQNMYAAQNNVALINEPSLVGDILINKRLYWPGFQEYVDLLAQNPDWSSLYQQAIMGGKVKSAFFFTFAVIHPAYSSENVRENYYRYFPTLVDRTLSASAARIKTSAKTAFIEKGVPVEQGIDKRLFGYDPALRHALIGKIKEENWVDLDDPVYTKNEETGETVWVKRSEIEKIADNLSLPDF